METLLNLVWLALAIAAFAYWGTKRRSRRVLSRFTVRTEVIALICILVLMFFSVSLTDDLHAEIILITDSTSGRRSLSLVSALKVTKLSAIPHISPFVAVHSVQAPIPNFAAGRVIPLEIFAPESSLVRPANGRAPPYLAA